MRASIHDLWGCAHGPVRRLAPPTRLLCGAAALAAILVAPATAGAGSLAIGAVGAVWLLACRPPWRVIRLGLVLGTVPLLPYFLLVPLLAAPGEGWGRAAAVPWSILARGLGATLVSLATVACLTATDLREALVRLPVPAVVAAILLQIVQQTATLLSETRQVAAAMAVRGASSGGRAAWRVVWNLPRVWLPRVLVRAERVAAAMELRGYGEAALPSLGSARRGPADHLALALAVGALALTIALRVGGLP